MKKWTDRMETPIQAELICYDVNGIHIVFGVTKEKALKLFHFSSAPFDAENLCRKPDNWWPMEGMREAQIEESFQLVQVNFSGYNRPYEKHGNKYIVTAPGFMLKFDSISEERNEDGDLLRIVQKDDVTGARVESVMQFYDGLPVARMYNTVTNEGSENQTLEYISSFSYWGIEKEQKEGIPEFISSDDKMSMIVVHNGWQKELTVKKYRFADLGMAQTQPHNYQRTSKTIEITNTGNWSAKEYIPMGYIGNSAADASLFFEIDHSGSWHYEIGDQNCHFYLAVSGPTEIQSHWSKNLKPGDSFTTVPVAVGVGHDDFEEAIGTLTKYRRRIRRPNKDNENLPVIFNDYMNCLFGDPTTEKEFPLVDAAEKAGCEYFVIDAGWYADGNWWDSVGEWQESRKRFPNGVREVTDYIRSKGMIPGVWLELEVMGINCKKASILPDECFFLRHGKRVYDRSRYQLDFRNPKVRSHADEVIDRLVSEYGIGYIKMDYNIEPGIGTEQNCDSVGEGLWGHEKAYLKWLDGVFARHPDLIIENCSSGGLRMDYAMLSRYSIQSTSDQDDYKKYCTIAANSPTALCPEQSAIWAYPITSGDREEVVFNMINAMLLRIHQSGHLGNIDPERKALVKEAISVYKKIRADIKEAVPFWSLGLSKFSDDWVSLGLRNGNKAYLAVWRREGKSDTCVLPIDFLKGVEARVKCIYPDFSETPVEFSKATGNVSVKFDRPYMARLFEIEW